MLPARSSRATARARARAGISASCSPSRRTRIYTYTREARVYRDRVTHLCLWKASEEARTIDSRTSVLCSTPHVALMLYAVCAKSSFYYG